MIFSWSLKCLTKSMGNRLFRKLNTFNVDIFPALEDNYMYLITDNASKECAVVDPVEPDSVLQHITARGLHVTHLLTTHHHWDHAGGNSAFLDQTTDSVQVVAHSAESRIDPVHLPIDEGSQLSLAGGRLLVSCLFTPCHTTGHVCYLVTASDSTESSALFSGDTLFVGGCGRFFEGTAADMETAMRRLSLLPDSTRVFCGHEYTAANLRFALHMEPDNVAVKERLQWAIDRVSRGLPTVPSTIAAEKATNPFMRVASPLLCRLADSDDPVDVTGFLRARKDSFRG